MAKNNEIHIPILEKGLAKLFDCSSQAINSHKAQLAAGEKQPAGKKSFIMRSGILLMVIEKTDLSFHIPRA